MGLFSLFQRQLPIDTAQIESAIADLELQTSAEVRVVVERKAARQFSALARAEQLFNELNMHQTADRNGVLIYLSFRPNRVAVVGDSGIHAKVSADFWQKIYAEMQRYCQAGEFTQAICYAISDVKNELAAHFPRSENDVNELSDEVIIK